MKINSYFIKKREFVPTSLPLSPREARIILK